MRMTSELFSDDSFNLGKATWLAHENHFVQICEQVRIVTQPSLNCPQCRMLLCIRPLRLRSSVETPDEGEDLISVLHLFFHTLKTDARKC